ncbi:organic hydroperoxide resistance protein [Nocardia sp. NPDC057440]|uniref:organic hydroperoxide resistance protein n=1 Tax=Nocardia sp. NPDC057440 TaxID=3346134 RepID=UPI00366DC527
MTKAIYTAQAHVTGGRNGRGRTEDGRLDLELRQPKELGGDGDGANPEQLFAIGYGACFASSLALVAQRRGLAASDVTVDARVMLVPAADGRFRLGAELDVSLPSITDVDQAVDLVRIAHQVCPYSNATSGNIAVALTANGTRL